MLIRPTFITILLVVSYIENAYSAISDNIQFLMFENFDLNRQNFIEELKIVKELQNYRSALKKWHAYHKENIDGLKTKKFDPHLPIASSKILKRYLGYKYLLDVENEAIVKVMFLLFNQSYRYQVL